MLAFGAVIATLVYMHRQMRVFTQAARLDVKLYRVDRKGNGNTWAIKGDVTAGTAPITFFELMVIIKSDVRHLVRVVPNPLLFAGAKDEDIVTGSLTSYRCSEESLPQGSKGVHLASVVFLEAGGYRAHVFALGYGWSTNDGMALSVEEDYEV
jgi:hypothetical protein